MSLQRAWLPSAILICLIAAGANPSAAQDPAQPQPDQTAPPPAPNPDLASNRQRPQKLLLNRRPLSASPRPTRPTPCPPAPRFCCSCAAPSTPRAPKPGDGVYLSSTFPVVVGNRVMIPAGVYVQGVVDRVQRGGRVKGKAQLDMHFTSIIFPNGSVVEIPGVVNSLPGARNQTVKDDGEGTIEQNGDKGRNAGQVAEIALPTGASVGSIGGARFRASDCRRPRRLGRGLATVGLVSLFTRGADVNIDRGTQVEMVLQRPLLLEEENLAGVGPPGAAPALVPAANQPKPITQHRPRILCPPEAWLRMKLRVI